MGAGRQAGRRIAGAVAELLCLIYKHEVERKTVPDFGSLKVHPKDILPPIRPRFLIFSKMSSS